MGVVMGGWGDYGGLSGVVEGTRVGCRGRDAKSCKRCKRRWCSKINTGVKILVSWDLFFGACHFCSLKTVDLANVWGQRDKLWQFLYFWDKYVYCFKYFPLKYLQNCPFVANPAVLEPNYMSRITLFWCKFLVLEKMAGVKVLHYCISAINVIQQLGNF